jgi:hypothetical protein
MSETPTIAYYYICNPDVVLREEDEDGALLFNPDTNQVKVINSTGLFIWKLCDGKHALSAIVEGLKNEFEDAPEEQVNQDTREYLEELLKSGFIGVPGAVLG